MMDIYRTIKLTDTQLRINTLGDAETRPKYREALVKYLTPHTEALTEISRERLSRNPLRILDTKVEAERVLLEDAPSLLDYVDEDSRGSYEALKGLLQSSVNFVCGGSNAGTWTGLLYTDCF